MIYFDKTYLSEQNYHKIKTKNVRRYSHHQEYSFRNLKMVYTMPTSIICGEAVAEAILIDYLSEKCLSSMTLISYTILMI